MPCGSRDKRRFSRRCLRCKTDHSKCDGQRPCSSCNSRGIECVFPMPTTDGITIIEYCSKPPKTFVEKPLIRIEWHYTNVFFQAIGFSASPLMSVFAFDSIGRLSQENDLVNRTVAIVGGVYASRNANMLCLSPSEKKKLYSSWTALKISLLEQMRGFRTTQFNTVLLCALLISFVELLLDKSGKTWRRLIRETSTYIVQNGRSPDDQGAFEASLFRFFRLSDALGSISMCEELAIPTACSTVVPQLEPKSTNQPDPRPRESLTEKRLDSFLNTLERWARLQHRALTWACESERFGFPSMSPEGSIPIDVCLTWKERACLISKHATVGIEIICMATRLQREIITSILSFAERDIQDMEPVFVSTIPYYHWGLTGLSRMFLHPAWYALNCELPVMEDEMIRGQAIAALDHAEGRLSRVEMETILYMPITYFVGLEMRGEEERKRVMDFIGVIKAKGFVVAAAFENDLRLAWTAVSTMKL